MLFGYHGDRLYKHFRTLITHPTPAIRRISLEKMSFRSRHYIAEVPKMPPGLVGIMEELSKDVLRNNPTDLYAFCAEHMKKLLLIRDGPSSKKVLTLEQKITLAKNKVRERAAQRHKNYDQKMLELRLNNVSNKKSEDNHTNKEQHTQENLVSFRNSESALNINHENNSINTEPEISMPVNLDIMANRDTEIIMSIPNADEDHNDKIKINDKAQENDSITFEGNEIENKIIEDEIENSATAVELKASKTEDSYKKDLTESNAGNGSTDCDKINVNNDIKQITLDESVNVEEFVENLEIINNLELKYDHEQINHDNEQGKLDITIVVDNVLNENDVDIDTQHKPADTISEKDNNEKKSISILSLNESNLESTSPNVIVTVSNDHEVLENVDSAFPDDVAKKNNDEILVPNHDIIINEHIPKIKYNESQSHVNNSSMDLETAAITIQKVFRSFLFRNKTLSVDDATNVDINLLIEDKESKDNHNDSNIYLNKERRTLGIGRMDSVLQTVNEEKSLSLSTDDSSTLSSAATIIQARVRGFLVRNKLNNNKTTSSTSGIDSDGQSFTSLEGENDYRKNKTVLNIHIVPEGGHFMSRDESILTSIDLSLDGSPPNSTNLHPLSERRKQLKREDAIQSISPPSNNSGKLSEDVDSVKEVFVNNDSNEQSEVKIETAIKSTPNAGKDTLVASQQLKDENIPTMMDSLKTEEAENVELVDDTSDRRRVMAEMTSDEMDVITPHSPLDENQTVNSFNDMKLMHSGEYHDVVLPTKVSRSDASVARGE